jgi:CRP/FNR family cyclic AMP-dependent transcriptional regulator
VAKIEDGRAACENSARHPVLKVDPDLGRRLSGRRGAKARIALLAPVVELAPGAWSPRESLGAGDVWGALVLDGTLLRDVVLTGVACSELIGPGDVFSPLDLDVEERMVPSDVAWSVLEGTRLLLLDGELAAAAAGWPEILVELLHRKAARSFRLGVQMAICQLPRVETRLLLILWHLAERWGHVGLDDVALPLQLSHRLLGQMVGARRPTVTLALARLDEAGLVHRHDDGVWVLHGHRPGRLGALQQPRRERAPTRAAERPTPGPAAPGSA